MNFALLCRAVMWGNEPCSPFHAMDSIRLQSSSCMERVDFVVNIHGQHRDFTRGKKIGLRSADKCLKIL